MARFGIRSPRSIRSVLISQRRSLACSSCRCTTSTKLTALRRVLTESKKSKNQQVPEISVIVSPMTLWHLLLYLIGIAAILYGIFEIGVVRKKYLLAALVVLIGFLIIPNGIIVATP